MVYIEEHTLSHSLEVGDALIAATAVEHKLPLASGNAKHFRKYQGVLIFNSVPFFHIRDQFFGHQEYGREKIGFLFFWRFCLISTKATIATINKIRPIKKIVICCRLLSTS